MVQDDVETFPCARHPNRETALRCGKCGDPICPRCVVQTPVGARCAPCANSRRLPQFDVGGVLLARSAGAGLAVSIICWLLISYLAFLQIFLSFLVGAAVGETMSRLARRRSNVFLEAAAVAVIVGGLVLVDVLRFGDSWMRAGGVNQIVAIGLVIPAIIASFVAVIKLR